jgi:hypothetical protein
MRDWLVPSIVFPALPIAPSVGDVLLRAPV